MKFKYNIDREILINTITSKADKKKVKAVIKNNSINITLLKGKFTGGEDTMPLAFKGKIKSGDDKCSISGKFVYGFHLRLIAALIVARFIWSAAQNQLDNMILCGIVTILFLIAVIGVNVATKKARKIIVEFLSDLNLK